MVSVVKRCLFVIVSQIISQYDQMKVHLACSLVEIARLYDCYVKDIGCVGPGCLSNRLGYPEQ